MVNILGISESLALFQQDTKAVVIDKDLNLVIETGDAEALFASRKWTPTTEEFTQSTFDLAQGALANLEIKIIASGSRMYTIPKGVQNEAIKSLEWHKEFHRGGTPVGLNTARTLAKGGQIGIEKVRHIAKYFPRHEVDKKGKGWEPGEENFPSRGRIAWALWGGDAGWRWAQTIVERENKKALTSDGYATTGYYDSSDEYAQPRAYDADIDAFKQAYEQDEMLAPEFLARVRLDGSGIDRLYKLDFDGMVYVWDDCGWDNLSHVDGDIYSYDKTLDDPYDTVEKSHIVIDPDSAIIISARLQADPFTNVTVNDIDADEAELVARAVYEVDWDVVDYAITAATAPTTAPAADQTGGQYTPAERSQNARKQVRDKGGKFAATGSRVVIGGDTQNGVGFIKSINPATQSVSVQLDNGKLVDVPASTTEKADTYINAIAREGVSVPPLDTSGILAQPRTPIDRPGAQIPGTLPALQPKDMSNILNDFPAWVQEQRNQFKAAGAPNSSDATGGNLKATTAPSTSAPATAPKVDPRTPLDTAGTPKLSERAKGILKDVGKETATTLTDAYSHPLLKNFLNKTVKASDGSVTHPNRLWYQPSTVAHQPIVKPVTSAGAPVEMTPDNSDVQPLFIALVSPDDPRAVLELVSLVPASETSNTPMTYKRVGGKWVRDEGILADLNSPTPPPVVPLDSETLNSVLEQVDTGSVVASGMLAGTVDHILTVLWGPSLTAAGGRDRNRGNAETLRRYWAHGKGAAKIRWGTPGDWKRCVRHLSKFMGERAKGYCQLRHKEATGMYTATHAARDRGRNNSVQEFVAGELPEGWPVKDFTGGNGAPAEPVYTFPVPKVYQGVPKDHLKMDLDEILAEHDDLYDHEWEPEDHIKMLMVELHGDHTQALEAAGGPDRNRGNAERLRLYWTTGKGGMKIRWNTKGDWTRCVRHLSKFLGPRAKGYCALRHHEMTGQWTGDKAHMQLFGRKGGRNVFSTDVITSQDAVVEQAIMNARAAEARNRVGLTAAGEPQDGAKFSIPLVIPEGIESGDGRKFKNGAIDIRELPLPLMWQIKTADGHMGSVVVGRIDFMERTAEGIGNATGVFDTGEYGCEAERLVRGGFLKGVSADMDKFEAQEEVAEAADDTEGKVANNKINITKARVMGVTIVPKPAFQECKIILVEEPTVQEESVIPDGVYMEDVDPVEASALVACGMIAGAIPVVPPKSWFENPQLKKATPLTVTDDGRVFGHIAAWHVDHIGLSFGTKPPRSKSKYAYFHTGVVRTDDGTDVPVGQLTLAGGHAPLEASAVDAARHYDDTASAVSDVHAGEDAYGIWVAGALRPSATPEQIRALRASAPSGDWRPIRGSLELVAVCQVNVPGFPIARARVASGQVMALVAAGANTLARMKSDPVAELAARVHKLEQLEQVELSAKLDAARARFAPIREARKAELAARMAELQTRVKGEFAIDEFEDGFGYISREKRQKLADQGKALPDGSFPISDTEDLKNAISSYGRAKDSKKAAVRRHIMKRARVLDQHDLIPEEWKALSIEDLEFNAQDLRSRIPAVTASAEVDELAAFAEISDNVREKLAKKGQALPDGSYPIRNAVDLKNAIKSYGRANKEDRAKVRKHIEKRARALGKADLIPQEWTTASTAEVDSLGKASAAEFGNEPGIYTPETQPRDDKGKFRTVLARIKQDLGDSGLQGVIDKVKTTEDLHNAGNYTAAAQSATELLSVIDRIDSKALNPQALENVRQSAKLLGETIANLPLPFGAQAEKVRFSDIPPALKDLVKDMISRVEDKIGKKDADVATEKMRSYMAGGDVLNQGEISSEMSKLLRLLT